MNIRKLLKLHALITLAAAAVLMFAPGLISSTVNIHLQDEQYLLVYFLAAAEFSMAYLSFSARKLMKGPALRLVCLTLIIFHGGTAAVELLAIADGSSLKLFGNIVARLVIITMLYYYGILKVKAGDNND